jgi:glycosidase
VRATRALLLLACAALAGCAGPSAPPSATQPGIDVGPVPVRPSPSALSEGWHHGAFMEIFVRAWRDSDGDGIGDFNGLTQTLPYLHELGIRGLWLMPITRSADGDHGYATADHREVDPAYGTLADFDRLLVAAHRLGIGVIADYVVNHAAASHPLFRDALRGPRSPYRDWWVWSDAHPPGWDIWGVDPWYHVASEPWAYTGDPKQRPRPPAGARGFYFATFGAHMPDFDMRNPRVQQYHFDSLRWWLQRGLDGFRLDAVPHLVENDARDWNDQPESRRLTRQLQDLIKSYPNRYVVCEATAEPQSYGDPAVCGGAFAFGHAHHYIEAARGKAESVAQLAAYWRHASPTMATFLSSHDRFAGERLWDQLGGDEKRYKIAAAGYLLAPGTPFVYYGEEVGMAGARALAGDLPLRCPMSWTGDAATAGFTTGRPFRPVAPNVATHNVAAQQAGADSILAFYKAMLKLRNTWPSIARGSFEHSFADGLLLGYQRRWRDERTLVLINYADAPAAARVQALPAGALLDAAYPEGGAGAVAMAAGEVMLEVPAQSVRVYVVRR